MHKTYGAFFRCVARAANSGATGRQEAAATLRSLDPVFSHFFKMLDFSESVLREGAGLQQGRDDRSHSLVPITRGSRLGCDLHKALYIRLRGGTLHIK